MHTVYAFLVAVSPLLAVSSFGASPWGDSAEEVNKVIRTNLERTGSPFARREGYLYNDMVWPLKAIFGKRSKLVSEENRRGCLETSFIAAVHERDEPFAACVLMRIRREVEGFTADDENALVSKALESARFMVDSGRSTFHSGLMQCLGKCSSPAGYTFVRMRTIRISPFIIRPPTTIADVLERLNSTAVAADYVNGGMGVKFVLKSDGDYVSPQELPKIQFGEYQYFNLGVTIEDVLDTLVAVAGYAYEIRPDGVVSVFRKHERGKR